VSVVTVALPSFIKLKKNLSRITKTLKSAGELIVVPYLLEKWSQSKGADNRSLKPISPGYKKYKSEVTSGPMGKPRPVIDMMLTGKLTQGLKTFTTAPAEVVITTSGAGAPAPLTKSKKKSLRKAGIKVSAFKKSKSVPANLEKLRYNVRIRPNLMKAGKELNKNISAYVAKTILSGV